MDVKGTMKDPGSTPTLRRVGVPIHERLLTDAFQSELHSITRSGPGRSIFVIEEAALGAGRPDLILLTISTTGLDRFRALDLRLASPVAAKSLDPTLNRDDLGVSRSYAAELRRDLDRQGWLNVDSTRLSRLVYDSLAIEAKVKDWRSAVRQVAKFRRQFHRSAVLMPERLMPPESMRALEFYGCGLLFQRGAAEFGWERLPTMSAPPEWARLWLLELLVRGLEHGTAYRVSADRNAESASPYVRRRPR